MATKIMEQQDAHKTQSFLVVVVSKQAAVRGSVKEETLEEGWQVHLMQSSRVSGSHLFLVCYLLFCLV